MESLDEESSNFSDKVLWAPRRRWPVRQSSTFNTTANMKAHTRARSQKQHHIVPHVRFRPLPALTQERAQNGVAHSDAEHLEARQQTHGGADSAGWHQKRRTTPGDRRDQRVRQSHHNAKKEGRKRGNGREENVAGKEECRCEQHPQSAKSESIRQIAEKRRNQGNVVG